MKTVFIKNQTNVGSAWASVLDHLSTHQLTNETLVDNSILNYRKYDQRMFYYHKVSPFAVRFFRKENDQLSLGIPTSQDQDLTVTDIDLDGIFAALDNVKYNQIYFGYHLVYDSVNTLELTTISKLYARSLLTGKIEDVSTGIEISDSSLEMMIWFTVIKIKGTELYYMILNPNMVTLVDNDAIEIEKTVNNVNFKVINTHDNTLKSHVFAPEIKSPATLVSDNIIYTTSTTVEIDVLGNSALHGYSGTKLPADQLPILELVVDCSASYTVDNNNLTINMGQSTVARISYRVVTDSFMDYSMVAKDEKLVYNFIIVKE